MGSGYSSMGAVAKEGGSHEAALGDWPECCVAAVMLHLDPAEICCLARLSRAFRGAATADFVWESKLPETYRDLILKVDLDKDDLKGFSHFLTKKEIYAQLCRRNRFDGGTKEFWMEKKRGDICMSISSKALSITGIDDRRYWNYIPTDESRFHTVACLQQIWWLEVVGEIDFCFLLPSWYTQPIFPPSSWSILKATRSSYL